MIVLLFMLPWQQKVDYIMDIKVDTEKHILYGWEEIVYKNNSPDTIHEIYMHLYPNAYRKNSVMFREVKRLHRETDHYYPCPRKDAYLKVKSITSGDERIEFDVKGTILHASLKKPILPGEERRFRVEFEEYIPALFARWGRFKTNYHISQWYPKMAVYDVKGWHPDEFHLYGEFYGDFGDYYVSITVPSSYKIAASGVKVSSSKNDDGTKTERFIIKNSHDFAFCMDKRYKVLSKMVRGVKINVYYFSSKGAARRALEYAERGLLYYWDKYGEYGYREMDVVETEPGPGGMEYPGLVMIEKAAFELPKIADYFLEDVVVHEIGHNWWYGVIANNETDEAWLDEGINTFSDRRYIEDYYGMTKNLIRYPRFLSWLPNLGIRYVYEENMMDMEKRGYGERILKRSHEFRSGNSYSNSVYIKASFVMDLLRDSLGEEKFDEVMKEYYRRYRYRLVSTQNFIETVNDVTGEDWTEFFNYWLNSDRVDYRKLVGLNHSRRKGVRIAPIFDFPKGDEILITLTPYFIKKDDTLSLGLYTAVKKRLYIYPTMYMNLLYNTETGDVTTMSGINIPLYIFKRPVRYQELDIGLREFKLRSVYLRTSFGPYFSDPPYFNVDAGYLKDDSLSLDLWNVKLLLSDMNTSSLSGWALRLSYTGFEFNMVDVSLKRKQRILWETSLHLYGEYGYSSSDYESYMFNYNDIPGDTSSAVYNRRTLLNMGINFPIWHYPDLYLLREYLKLSRIHGEVNWYLYDLESVKQSVHISLPVAFTFWNILSMKFIPGYTVYSSHGKRGFTFDFRIGL